MIAYSTTSLDNKAIHEEAAKARKRTLLDEEELAAVKAAHPVNLYSPNLFIRIGLFLATALIALMSMGLLSLFLGAFADSETGLAIIVAIFGLGIYAALEYVIREKHHYRSGVDDALLWTSFGMIAGDLVMYFEMSVLQGSITVLILALYCSVRFANSFMTAVAFGSFLCVLFFSITPFGTVAKIILPFLTMVVSVCIYWYAHGKRNLYDWRHYRYCILMIEFLSLITTYLSVNYFVVRQLSVAMFDLPHNSSVTGSIFFWIATFLIPAIYIWRALQTKNALQLRTGLLLVAAAVFTFRAYFSLAPVEQVMTVAGIVLVAASYFLIRYLQKPRNGIVDKMEESDDELHAESLVVSETFKPETVVEPGFKFGGGSTGGGGATGQF